MSELENTLRADLTAAMKAKDTLRTTTVRSLLAALKTASVSGSAAHELTDAEAVAVLQKEAKKRNEAAVIYQQNGRGELAATERAEEEIIERYLPTQLNEAEVADIVDTAIADVAEANGERPGMRQMGQVMKIATQLANGRADGSRLSAAVKARL